LEEDFEEACEGAVDECRKLGYLPTAWIKMMRGPGGAPAAAQRLMVSGDIQSGFERLIRMGRTDLTIEQAILDDYWRPLFEERHREAARWRLPQASR
jgi:hypothetical protein